MPASAVRPLTLVAVTMTVPAAVSPPASRIRESRPVFPASTSRPRMAESVPLSSLVEEVSLPTATVSSPKPVSSVVVSAELPSTTMLFPPLPSWISSVSRRA